MWETFYTSDLEQKEAAMARLGRGDEDLGEYFGRGLADEPRHADYMALAVSMLIKTNRPAEAELYLVGAAEDKSGDYIAQILRGPSF